VKRVLTGIALVVLLAAIGVSSALARGGKQTISAICTVNGAVTVHASSGQSAWVNNTHWVVLRFTLLLRANGAGPVGGIRHAGSSERSSCDSGFIE